MIRIEGKKFARNNFRSRRYLLLYKFYELKILFLSLMNNFIKNNLEEFTIDNSNEEDLKIKLDLIQKVFSDSFQQLDDCFQAIHFSFEHFINYFNEFFRLFEKKFQESKLSFSLNLIFNNYIVFLSTFKSFFCRYYKNIFTRVITFRYNNFESYLSWT